MLYQLSYTPRENWEGRTKIEWDGKDDNHKDVGLEFCTLHPGDDTRVGGNDLLQCSWASLHVKWAKAAEHSH